MTSNRGYIYVLANSSMPELVKVGKTTRTPSERAAELSKVTGVPTPFIVVYEQLVDDCTAAEEFVHTVLEQQGFRESNNREFFRATPNEVIRIVMNVPNQVSSQLKFKTIQNEEMVDLQIAPWTELWEIAENYFHGRNFCIKSYNEALIIYKKAVKLGCLLAYYRIGNIYYEISKENQLNKKAKEEAFDWYKKGADKGNYYCLLEMANFLQNENFHDCYRKFIKNYENEYNQELEGLFSNYLSFIDRAAMYIYDSFGVNTIPNNEIVIALLYHEKKLGTVNSIKESLLLSLQIQVDERDPFQKFFEEIEIKRIKSNGRSSKSYNLYTSSFGHKVIDILLRNGFSNITPLLDNYIIEGFKVNFSNKKFEGYFKDKLISSKYQPAVKWIKKDLRLGNIRRSK